MVFLQDIAFRRDVELWQLPWKSDSLLHQHLLEKSPITWIYVCPLSLGLYVMFTNAHRNRNMSEVDDGIKSCQRFPKMGGTS